MKRGCAVGLALIVLAGCGSGGRFGSPGHYRRVFLRIAGPVDKARTDFNGVLAGLGQDPSSDEMRKAAAPLATALHNANVKLSRDTWPPRDEHHIMALVMADKSLIQALNSAAVHRRVPGGRWESAVIDNVSVVNSADAQVHNVLGLPPPY